VLVWISSLPSNAIGTGLFSLAIPSQGKAQVKPMISCACNKSEHSLVFKSLHAGHSKFSQTRLSDEFPHRRVSIHCLNTFENSNASAKPHYHQSASANFESGSALAVSAAGSARVVTSPNPKTPIQTVTRDWIASARGTTANPLFSKPRRL
jgi:hypothetical protein